MLVVRETPMKLIRFTPLEILLVIGAGILVLGIGAYDQVANSLFLVPEVREGFEQSIDERFDVFLGLIDQFEFSASLITGLIWNIIGAFVFIFVWMIINVVADIKNNLKISSSFVHDQSFHQSDFWGAYVLRLLFKAAIVIGLVAGTALWITVYLPTAFTAIRVVLADDAILAQIFGMLGVFVATVITLHLLVILKRLLFWHGAAQE